MPACAGAAKPARFIPHITVPRALRALVPSAGNTDASDLRRFYSLISECTGRRLDPLTDPVRLSVANDWRARNASGYLILCRAVSGRCAIIKRCLDDPEYIRRELLVASVKSAIGWEPRYSVIEACGIVLRDAASGRNHPVLAGWEDKTSLVIDIGNPDAAKDMNSLSVADIADLGKFCRDYGEWGAFNYSLGIRDRNAFNFMFFTDTQTLHSIDNEEGPFGDGGNLGYEDDIIPSMRGNIARLLGGVPRGDHARAFRSGFMSGWDRIKSHSASLCMLNEYEMHYLEDVLSKDPSSIADEFLRGGPARGAA